MIQDNNVLLQKVELTKQTRR